MANESKRRDPSAGYGARILFMSESILILFGSVTGNSEICAEWAVKELRKRGHEVKLESMADAKAEVFSQHRTVLVVTSTYGDGEPPDGTESLYEAVVKGETPVDMTGVRFSVFALGDSVYELFCQCGRDYDEAMERLGGERVHPRVECDGEYDDLYEEWIKGVGEALESRRASAGV